MRSAATTLAVALLLAAPAGARADDPGDGREAAPPSPASAVTGQHCLGEPRPRWLASTRLAGQLNPRGLELRLQAGRCLPLVTAPGPLFDHTSVQFGLAANLSPVYAMPGVYLSVAPLSLIELRAEAGLIRLWRVGLDGAGYFPLAGYGAPLGILPAASARAARGYTASVTATLRGALPLGARWSLLAVDSGSAEAWRLGDASHYYNVRYDLVMARRDGLLRNVALVLASHQLSDRTRLRFGVFDELSWVTGAGQGQNLVGALLAAVLTGWPGPRSETQPFLRVGGYTAHRERQGELQLLAGVGVTFDLVSPAR